MYIDTDTIASTEDPTARAIAAGAALADVPQLQATLRQIRQEAVREMRAAGMSHAEVGRLLGLHPQRAAQIAAGVTGGKRKPPSSATPAE